MSYLMNNQQKLNEIIFANRNKAYGAYTIRSSYGNTMLKSLSTVLFVLTCFCSTVYYLSNHVPVVDPAVKFEQTKPDTVTYWLKLDPPAANPDEPQPHERHSTPPANPNNQTSTSTSTLVSDSVRNEAPVNTTLVATTTSTASEGSEGGTEGGSEGGKKGPGVTVTPTPAIASPVEVDNMPEYEGGLKALGEFLSRNLRYPEPASGLGVGGVLYVRFVVDETGKVVSPELLNHIGYGLDDEALRVVSIIPKFKTPARIKGRPVKSYYQVPIRFKPVS